MREKIITQRAQGYGFQPVTVTVQIDGTTVLAGEIPTQDAVVPLLPDQWTSELGANAWSWTVASDFVGTQNMTISVDNGIMLLCDTFYQQSDPPGNIWPLTFVQGNVGNVPIGDPFTSVTINGVAQEQVRSQSSTGQWIWTLQAGDQFACTVNIVPYTPPPESTP